MEHVIPVGKSSQGLMTLNGQVMKPGDGLQRLGGKDIEHLTMSVFFAPNLEIVVRDILHEIAEMREARVLRPFVELSLPSLGPDTQEKRRRRRGLGDPIGAYRKLPKRRALTDAQVRRERNQRMQWRQIELKELRRKNNAALKEVLA